MNDTNAGNYVFISYAHKDAAKVLPVLKKLEELNVRFWFDEGIEAGAEWAKSVAGRLRSSGAVIVFTSAAYGRSQNCARELNFAVSERKPILRISLDENELPDDTSMQLSGVRKIEHENAKKTAEEIGKALPDTFKGEPVRTAGIKKTKKKVNGWAIAAVILILFIVAAAVFAAAAFKGLFGAEPVLTYETVKTPDSDSVSVTTFNSALALEAALRSLGAESVYLAGDSLVSDASVITHGEDGFYVAGRPIGRGRFSDLSWLEGQNIKELALVYVNVSDLSGVTAFKNLTYLDISGDPVTDLSALASLPELQTLVMLDLPQNADLAVLAAAPKLTRVVISYGMRDGAEALVDAGIEVIMRK